ncbi:DUF7535 family protein [Halodesulfurarchaeum sp.]|uniref:DUF7535 family protein n=1 Tax=Halodesulfurarchaeum sp. TaxID=1980530 RepID=UPI002FC34B91
MDTVTPPTPGHFAPEMSAFGWMMAAGIALILMPLWPLLAIMWILGKTGTRGKKRGEKHPDDDIPI